MQLHCGVARPLIRRGFVDGKMDGVSGVGQIERSYTRMESHTNPREVVLG